MIKNCPNCETPNSLEICEYTDFFEVKGEQIEVTFNALWCNNCHHKFIEAGLDDPFNMAYEKYNKRKIL